MIKVNDSETTCNSFESLLWSINAELFDDSEIQQISLTK